MGQINYELTLQRIDDENNILTDADIMASLPLPSDIASDTEPLIQPGQIDQPIPLISGYVDFILIIPPKTVTMTVKFNDTGGTPFTLRPKGMGVLLDAQNITGIFVSNPSDIAAGPRVIQAVRQQ